MKRLINMSLVICSLVAFGVLPSIGQELPADVSTYPTPAWAGQHLKNSFMIPMKEQERFKKALANGDVATVKALNEKYPYGALLITPVEDDGYKVSPICVATKRGKTDMVKYMLEQYPTLTKVRCTESGQNLLDIALVNKHADTAVELTNSGLNTTGERKDDSWRTPLLIKIARNIKDKKALSVLIPAVLDTGVRYNEVVLNKNRVNDYDAFYAAALKNNTNFIVILRDELKKRGTITPISKYYSQACIEFYEKKAAVELRKNVEARKEGKLLTEHGIRIEADYELIYENCG